jgi:hypothetical protein
MSVVIKVRKGQAWVPIESLTPQQQAVVKGRAESVLRDTVKRQIDVQDQNSKRAG